MTMEPAPDVSQSRMRTFLAVADTGSVRAAAASLHVTEPAVSTALGQLRRVLGVDLVRREGRGVRLTAAGEVYAGYCRTIMGLLEQAYALAPTSSAIRLHLAKALLQAGEKAQARSHLQALSALPARSPVRTEAEQLLAVN